MVRNKVIALVLASCMITGSLGTTIVSADETEGVVTSSSVLEEGETVTEGEESESPDPGTEELPPASNPEQVPDVEIGTGEEVKVPEDGNEVTDDSVISPSEDASDASNESQAPEETVGHPGVPAPDLSWVSPYGVKSRSYQVSNLDPVKILSDAVRKSYTKIEARYAISKKDNAPILEEKKQDSRVVGTIPIDGALNLLKIQGDYLYVESGNVRGYVWKKDMRYGEEALKFLKDHDFETLPHADLLIPLEENAAADDFFVTIYQFENKTGEDVAAYARRHILTEYKKDGTEWKTGLNNKSFMDRIYSFFNLYEPATFHDGYEVFGTEIKDLKDAKAGDLFVLDDKSYCMYLGKDDVIICTKKDKGVSIKSIHDVLITMIRRPDYEHQVEEKTDAAEGDILYGETAEEQCWNYLTGNLGLSDGAAAGFMGNIRCESGFNSGSLENWVNSQMNCSNEQFTAAVDNGIYSQEQFFYDRYTYPLSGNGSQWGYGLIGFTSVHAKAVLWANTVALGRSLSDLKGQLDAVSQIYGEKLGWLNPASPELAAEDCFYYIEMGNPYGGRCGYGYEYTIPQRQAYAAEYYQRYHH